MKKITRTNGIEFISKLHKETPDLGNINIYNMGIFHNLTAPVDTKDIISDCVNIDTEVHNILELFNTTDMMGDSIDIIPMIESDINLIRYMNIHQDRTEIFTHMIIMLENDEYNFLEVMYSGNIILQARISDTAETYETVIKDIQNIVKTPAVAQFSELITQTRIDSNGAVIFADNDIKSFDQYINLFEQSININHFLGEFISTINDMTVIVPSPMVMVMVNDNEIDETILEEYPDYKSETCSVVKDMMIHDMYLIIDYKKNKLANVRNINVMSVKTHNN